MNAIQEFLAATTFAVAGASRDRSKYGNQVFRSLLASGRTVYPLNPHAKEIEGTAAYPFLENLPQVAHSLSIVTPPHITREIVRQAVKAGVTSVWMQPGAEDELASQEARSAGLKVIDDGSCILVSLSIERSKNR